MRRVAAEVDLTPMATYRHYRNREALLQAVADECFDELGRTWAERTVVTDPRARIFALLDDFLDFALGTPHLYTYLMTERREQARTFPEDYRAGDSPAFAQVMSAVEYGMGEGLLRSDDVTEVTVALTASAQGLIVLYLGGRIGLTEPEFRALCHRSVRRVLDGLAN